MLGKLRHVPLLLLLAGSLVMSSTGCTFAKEGAERIAANNMATIRQSIGKSVVIHGKVQRTNASRSGVQFLNFYSSELTVVCMKEDVAKFEKGGPAELYKNADIEVAGKLELYRGKPQIVVKSPSEIRKIDADRAKQANIKLLDTSNFELRQVGKETWLSPAGLRYSGRDPEGLTRVEHVLRHAKDQPNRAGSHGVFVGDDDQALAIVDEAWKLVKKNKIKPKTENNTSAFTVSMGRTVGHLGGQAGQSKGKPPLRNVFIVVRDGTNDVITAFPR